MLRLPIQLIVFVVIILSFSSSAMAGSCLRDFRNISHGGENMRLRDYHCRGDNGAKVRVQFHRVTDFVATAMLDNTLPPNFQPILGNVKPVSNEIYSEFLRLMDSFGQRHKRLQCESYKVIASGGVGVVQEKQTCDYDKGNGEMRKTLGGWEDGAELTLPISGDMKTFIRNRVPRGYKNISSTYDRSIGSREYWRYARSSDLKNYSIRIRSFNRIMTRTNRMRDKIRVTPYMKMLSYITRKGMPKKFLNISVSYSSMGGCDESTMGWSSSATMRGMLVDFAVIENVSGQSVQLSELQLAHDKLTKLRSTRSSKRLETIEPRPLAGSSISLGPDQKVVLFQRLAFIDSGIYYGEGRKKLPAYVYGPQVLLRKFKLGDEQYDLQGNSANFISLTAGVGEGSCPFVYAWDESEKAFVNHGKILDKAIGAGLEQSESMSFKGFVSRFRIAEEEAEVAHLDEVYLTVEMKGGKTHRLPAHIDALNSIDKQRVSLYMGNTLEFTFKLPKSLKDKDVIRSTLTAHGYYDRYSALTTARNDSQEAIACPIPEKTVAN